jgi:COPII coat assembly protein SEC16
MKRLWMLGTLALGGCYYSAVPPPFYPTYMPPYTLSPMGHNTYVPPSSGPPNTYLPPYSPPGQLSSPAPEQPPFDPNGPPINLNPPGRLGQYQPGQPSPPPLTGAEQPPLGQNGSAPPPEAVQQQPLPPSAFGSPMSSGSPRPPSMPYGTQPPVPYATQPPSEQRPPNPALEVPDE